MKKAGKAIRRMGFIRDQEGIMNRYLRESSRWKEHLEKTRSFISGSFRHTGAESAAVLGSGWLLDVPLDDLLGRFKHIYLVDIHHPIQIRKKTASLRQVELIEEDLSGGIIEQVWNTVAGPESDTSNGPDPEQFMWVPPLSRISPDVLISVNLLNQLDILLCDYLLKKKHFQQEALAPFRRAIQSFHLEWISRKPGCLVTDVREEVRDKNGVKSSKTLIYARLPDAIRQERWWWDFDSLGTYHPESLTRMEVQALEWE